MLSYRSELQLELISVRQSGTKERQVATLPFIVGCIALCRLRKPSTPKKLNAIALGMNS